MSDAVLMEAVSKRYRVQQGSPLLVHRVRDALRGRSGQELVALRDVSFRVGPGETVGFVGRNGAGKTTLLRLLSGVSAPTSGRVRVAGRIAPLIGVGVGFDPELTGRENVEVNGRLLGLTAGQVRDRFDDIVAFSEIESFIDTPVKFYSSGMFLRLAFAVAVHTDPDVFLLDEVLAVGDMAFQAKCFERLRRIQAQGTTVLVVTHSLEVLERIAPRAIVLVRGGLIFDGPTEAAISAYARSIEIEQEDADRKVGGAGVASRLTLDLLGPDGLPSRHFGTGDRVVLALRGQPHAPIADPVVHVRVSHPDGTPVFTFHSPQGGYLAEHGPGRPLEATVSLDLHLLTGDYVVRGAIFEAGREVLAESPPLSFSVFDGRQGLSGTVDLAPVLTMGGAPVPVPEHRPLGSGR